MLPMMSTEDFGEMDFNMAMYVCAHVLQMCVLCVHVMCVHTCRGKSSMQMATSLRATLRTARLKVKVTSSASMDWTTMATGSSPR